MASSCARPRPAAFWSQFWTVPVSFTQLPAGAGQRPVRRAGQHGHRVSGGWRIGHVDVSPVGAHRDVLRAVEAVRGVRAAGRNSRVGDAARSRERAVGRAIEADHEVLIGRGHVDGPAAPRDGEPLREVELVHRQRAGRRRRVVLDATRRAEGPVRSAGEDRDRLRIAGGHVQRAAVRADGDLMRTVQRGNRRAAGGHAVARAPDRRESPRGRIPPEGVDAIGRAGDHVHGGAVGARLPPGWGRPSTPRSGRRSPSRRRA